MRDRLQSAWYPAALVHRLGITMTMAMLLLMEHVLKVWNVPILHHTYTVRLGQWAEP